MRSAIRLMLVLWVRSGTQSAIVRACWWWWIMPCMNSTSTCVEPKPAGVGVATTSREGSPGAPGWITFCSARAWAAAVAAWLRTPAAGQNGRHDADRHP